MGTFVEYFQLYIGMKKLYTEVIPIKTIFLSKKYGTPEEEELTWNQNPKSIRDFKFRNLKSIKRFSTHQSMDSTETIKQNQQKIQTRSNSNPAKRGEKQRMNSYQRKKQRRYLVDNNKTNNLSQRTKTPRGTQEENLRNLKNYFPKRKSKKNSDPSWHRYSAIIKISEKQLKMSEITKNTSASKAEEGEKISLMKRKKSLNIQRFMKSLPNKCIRSKSSRCKLQNEISPWNTVFVEKGNIDHPEDHYRIAQYEG